MGSIGRGNDHPGNHIGRRTAGHSARQRGRRDKIACKVPYSRTRRMAWGYQPEKPIARPPDTINRREPVRSADKQQLPRAHRNAKVRALCRCHKR